MPRSSARTPSRNGSGTVAKRRSAAAESVATSVLQGREPSHEPDVFLNVPDLHVGEIRLDVENLRADLSLSTRLANLLELQAGAHVEIEKVELDIKDVEAKALLEVRLENVYSILDRALTTLDRNPEILEGVGQSLERLTSGVGEGIGGLGKLASGRAKRQPGRRAGRVTHAAGRVRRRFGHILDRPHVVTKV